MSALRLCITLGAALLAGACATAGPNLTGTDEPSGVAAAPSSEPPPAMAATPPPTTPPAQRTAATAPPREQRAATERPPARSAPPAQQAARTPAAGSGGMSGSWQFSDGKQACVMTLAGGAGSGSVSAAGNCWKGYANARGWRLQGNEMVLTDSANQPIARMQSTDTGRYDGYGADGEPVVLVR